MNTVRLLKKISYVLIPLAFASNAPVRATDISTVPLNTYSATSSTDIKPNILFILDDSGSMNWDFMPDWACAPQSTRNPTCASTGQDPLSAANEFWFRNAGYNGIYYNPAIVYTPPVAVNSSGVTNTTTYPSMTAGNSSSWTSVKDDAYNVQNVINQSGGTVAMPAYSNLTLASKSPYFFTFVPGVYCTAVNLRVCANLAAPNTTYPYPAPLQWCDSAALTNCRAAFDATFAYAKAPSPRISTISVGTSATATSVSSVKVNGVEIMAAGVAANATNTTVAQGIVDQINACTVIKTGSCGTVGYTASRVNGVVTITAPDATTFAPVVTKSPAGGMTFTVVAFAQGTVPGSNLRTTITPSVTSYPYPGTAAKAAARTDCAGATCTYAEEMTNYANWWTYYKTRMQMMKTAGSNAFSTIDTPENIAAGSSRFRMGYMSINNNTGSDFLNLNEFKSTQKYDWYTKLISAKPNNSTPLRGALSKAGRLYGGKYNGSTLNGSTVVDPMQYSCQQNFTILSTDGFWNDSSGFDKLDGSTDVLNQDAGSDSDRPYMDGGSSQKQTRTSTLQARTVAPQDQQKTSNLQSRSVTDTPAPPIMRRTSTNSGSTWTAWAPAASCVLDTSGTTRTDCQVPRSTSGDSGATWSAWSIVSSCTPDSSGASQTKCSGTVTTYGSWTNAASCTTSSTLECQYTAWSGSWTNTASCTPLAQSPSSPYTVGVAKQCQTVPGTPGAWANASTCTASSTQNCQYTTWTSWSNVSTCTPVGQSTSPNYTIGTAVECQDVTSGGTSNTLADVAMYYYKNDLRRPASDTGVASSDLTGTCTGPIIPPNTVANDLCENTRTPSANSRDQNAAQHMVTFTLGLGAQGQMIYAPGPAGYWADTSGDFYAIKSKQTANPATGVCSWQSSGDCNWPTPVGNTLSTIDDLWHAAVNGRGEYFSAKDPTTLSTALNSALKTIDKTPRPGTAAAAASSNPNVSASDNFVFSSSYKSVEWYGELIRQRINIDGTLTGQNWSAMRLLDCATKAWTPVTNYYVGGVYREGVRCYLVNADYLSGAVFDGASGGVDGAKISVIYNDEVTPTAGTEAVAKTSRTIYTKDGGSNSLIPFQWGSLSGTQQAFFSKPAIDFVSTTVGLSQFCASGASCLTAGEQTSASGANLVDFLRGVRTYEGSYYRSRTHVLGDIVSSEARYVAAPLFNYADVNYSAYKALKSARAGAVYVGSNDGMLHAFDATTGQENWAYVPSFVLPRMHRLADKLYSDQHEYLVDASPEVGDICPSAPGATCAASGWRTILVGGLNRGGKGYYALDVTDPANPSLLWEFADANLGYSYGNPKITKTKDGTWVVMLTAGYNGADGASHLYVVNASTGALIRTITPTGVTSSGMARISAHVLNPMTDNTTLAVYSGDEQGNLWRIDVNNDIGVAGYDAHRLVTLVDAFGAGQPITVKPLEATVDGNPIVYVGTGRYLGTSDVTNLSKHTFYAIKDKKDTTTYTNPRASSNFVQQVLTETTCATDTAFCVTGQTVRTVTNNAVDWTTKNGWYMDFLTAGERSVTDPALGLGTLLFTTVTPDIANADPCKNGSSLSFIYALNYRTGGAVSSDGVGAVSLGAGLVTRPVMIEQSDGTVRALIRTSSDTPGTGTDLGGTKVITPPVVPPSTTGARRVSWRELN